MAEIAMTIRQDLTGRIFGYLVVLEKAPARQYKKRKEPCWKCQCVCGTIKAVRAVDLVRGKSSSCGCMKGALVRKNRSTHGEASIATKEFRAWSAAKNRCSNPNNSRFHTHGGRGIRMCERWLNSYQSFLDDMGRAPEGMTLDRINNDGDYEPSNCRWTTYLRQERNTRRTIMVDYKGAKIPLMDVADIEKVSRNNLRRQFHKTNNIDGAIWRCRNPGHWVSKTPC